jgi:predicted RNA-binding Zn ribbon-like protein
VSATTEHRVLDATNGVLRAVAVITALESERVAASELAAIFDAHGQSTTQRVTDEDLRALQAIALRLREVFAAETVDRAAALINRLLSEYACPPRLSNSSGIGPWHLHVHDDAAPLAQWFTASSALALATLIGERQRIPGGVCARPGCQRLFADVGGGLSRRYCSERCATRARVAAYRSRHAAPQDAPQ